MVLPPCGPESWHHTLCSPISQRQDSIHGKYLWHVFLNTSNFCTNLFDCLTFFSWLISLWGSPPPTLTLKTIFAQFKLLGVHILVSCSSTAKCRRQDFWQVSCTVRSHLNLKSTVLRANCSLTASNLEYRNKKQGLQHNTASPQIFWSLDSNRSYFQSFTPFYCCSFLNCCLNIPLSETNGHA